MEHDCPFVSIVLLNYNGRNFADYWQPLFYLNYPRSRYEVIFVDNGSCDGSELLFAGMAARSSGVSARLFKLENNCGYSKANDFGVKHCRGDYIVLLSNDIKVAKDWLANAISILESDHKIGVAQSMMYTPDDVSEPDKMGNFIDVLGINHPFSLSDKVSEVFYSEGAVMFIRREVIDEAHGLFDEDYFMFYEDVDFCWRARLRGYKVVVMPSSIVYHKRGGTVSGTLMKTDPVYVFTNTRNRLNTLVKNYSTWNLFRFVPFSVAIEMLKGFLLLFGGKSKAGLACFKGIFSFVYGFRKTMRKRAIIQGDRKVDDATIMQFMVPLKTAFQDTLKNVKRLRDEWKTVRLQSDLFDHQPKVFC